MMTLSDNGIAKIHQFKSKATIAYHESVTGLNMIKGFEGCRLKAYQDTAGVWTIGWGSTRYANGQPVKKGDTLLNVECANDLLLVTLKYFEANVNRLVKVPITQNQFDALVSFDYNTGSLSDSTLLRKLNAGDFVGAAAQFSLWNKVTDPKTKEKRVYPVLTSRRAKECALFLKDIQQPKS